MCRIQIELAICSTRSTKLRNKIIFGPIKRFEKLLGILWQHLGVPLSAVEAQNTMRENIVKRLIEMFENHKHKESFIQDLSQTQRINKFSKESQDLIADLTPRSSNFAKILANSNVLTAIPTVKSVSSIAVVEEI